MNDVVVRRVALVWLNSYLKERKQFLVISAVEQDEAGQLIASPLLVYWHLHREGCAWRLRTMSSLVFYVFMNNLSVYSPICKSSRMIQLSQYAALIWVIWNKTRFLKAISCCSFLTEISFLLFMSSKPAIMFVMDNGYIWQHRKYH